MTPSGAHETTWWRGAGQDAVHADAPGLAQQHLGERRTIGVNGTENSEHVPE